MLDYDNFLLEDWRTVPYFIKYREEHSDIIDDLDVYVNNRYIDLNFVKIKYHFKNKGYFSDLMKELIKFSETVKKPIILSPESGHGTPIEVLETIYKKFGFEYLDKHLPGIPYAVTMIRYPI